MRPIPPAPAPGQRILLIPAMLDAHFPLLQYAFHSKAYYPVILSQSRGLADLGLRYAHNDLCYPFVLSLGQYLQALGSGAYDLDQVSLLMPSAGDACRGSNFPSLIRKALAAAGYPQVEVLTWNVKGLERDHALPRRPVARKRVALVGELYTKYCALGNWDILPFLEEAGCEVAVNGFSWYILYYISSQIAGTTGPVQALWRGLGAWMAGLQRTMTAALAAHGFHSLPPFPAFQREAADWISQTLRVADGWLIGAECAAHIHAGCHRVLAMQPFGCLPNHVCGRGQYAALLRRLGRGKVVSVDLDASLPRLLVYNRVKLLLEGEG